MTSFDKFLRKYIFRIIGGTLGALFHLFVIAKAVLEGGEGAMWAVIFMDFPIVYLWQFFIGPWEKLFGPTLYFLGTLMYALLGWLIGWIGDRYANRLKRRDLLVMGY